MVHQSKELLLDTSIPQGGLKKQQPDMPKAAWFYAKYLGWSVFPVHSIQNGQCTCGGGPKCAPGKHPMTRHGVKDATKDPSAIREYWTRYPFANIGIATGEPSGFFVLDCDGEEGAASLKELQEKYSELPETVQSITGSLGSHYLFRHVDGIKNIVKKLAPGLDLRGTGGFIVAPPSFHTSGRRYEWEISSRPLGDGSVPVADAPSWLLELIWTAQEGEKQSAHSVEHWKTILNGVGQGGRNHSAASLTGFLLRKNIDPEIAYMLVRGWNLGLNNPPLDEQELAKTFMSILEKDRKRREGEVIRVAY